MIISPLHIAENQESSLDHDGIRLKYNIEAASQPAPKAPGAGEAEEAVRRL